MEYYEWGHSSRATICNYCIESIAFEKAENNVPRSSNFLSFDFSLASDPTLIVLACFGSAGKLM